jgi:hypothetical protein
MQADIDWQMKKTKAKMEKQRAMETWLLAKRRARLGGGGVEVEIPKILRKRKLTSEEKAQKRAPELFRAVKSGNKANVINLIDGGIKPNVVDINGWTPLHHACIRGFTTLVEVLLRSGANIESLTNDRKTPLDMARIAGYGDVMKLIRQKLSNEALIDRLSNDEVLLIKKLYEEKEKENTLNASSRGSAHNDKSGGERVVFRGNRGYDTFASGVTDQIFLGRHGYIKTLLPSDPLALEWGVLLTFVIEFIDTLKNDKRLAMATITDAKNTTQKKKDMLENFKAVENTGTHIALRPTGYAFPLLSTFIEREKYMNTKYGIVPTGMNKSENLLRTLDKMSRNEVDSSGRRKRLNPIAKLTKSKKKKMFRNFYLHDIHNKKTPKVKNIKTVTSDNWLGATKPKKKSSWVDLQSRNTTFNERKLELMIHNLHEAQVDDAKIMKKINAINDTKFKYEMSTYAAMKSAKKEDQILELMDDANMLTLPQEINYLVKSKTLDEGLAYKFSKDL